MRTLRWIVELIGALVGLVALLVMLFAAAILSRHFFRVVTRGELEQLASSGPYNNSELATAVCGRPVSMLGADIPEPRTAFPEARLLSWRLLFPMEGEASARIVGAGLDGATFQAVGAPCQAIMTFRYRFSWSDNGRAIVLESQFLEKPKIVRRE
jgi:hypothetical protein